MPAHLRSLLVVAVAAVAAFVLTGGGANAQGTTTLHGSVGPEFVITLTDSAGQRVTHLDPGAYTIVVDDKSDEHNFHLRGLGVDQSTEVEFIGSRTWEVTFTDAVYQYYCDPHFSQMKGSFTVGTPVVAPPKPKPVKLVGNVGGASISLKRASGGSASSLKVGLYSITVHDRSKTQNFHFSGPGVNKSTGVGFVGNRTWTVGLKKGKYAFRSDPNKKRMKGTVRVS